MAPTKMAGADAEIVFLAIALGEEILTQQADFFEAVVPEIDAEAVRGWHLDHVGAVGTTSQTVEQQEAAMSGTGFGAILARIAEHRRIIGQRRRCPMSDAL